MTATFIKYLKQSIFFFLLLHLPIFHKHTHTETSYTHPLFFLVFSVKILFKKYIVNYPLAGKQNYFGILSNNTAVLLSLTL